MPEPKFMYGTHYSTPGYVLYYLVRIGMLRHQKHAHVGRYKSSAFTQAINLRPFNRRSVRDGERTGGNGGLVWFIVT